MRRGAALLAISAGIALAAPAVGPDFGQEADHLLGWPATRVALTAAFVAACGGFLLVGLRGGGHPAVRGRPAWIALVALQGLLLLADLQAGSRAPLGVLAVVALLPAGWLLDGWRAVVVLVAFACGRLVDYGLGGNPALTVISELGAGAGAMVAARAAARSVWSTRSQLAREASHELRTPLTVLHGYISMLADASFPPEQASELVPLLLGKTREINDRIDAMLDRVRTGR